MRSQLIWQLRTQTLPVGTRTRVMGIVNVTPDSFSDGGTHASSRGAVDHALGLLDSGADLLDLGGESTRPGSLAGTAEAIATEEEQRRVLPVIEGVLRARPDAIVSVDTYRAATARLAVDAGAEIVNDVSGLLWDEAMAEAVAEMRCGVVLMHARGLPSEWKELSALRAEEVAPMVRLGLEERLAYALAAGVERERIAIDPGFGFGKRGAENWALLAEMECLADLQYPVVAGLSRKGFLAPEISAQKRDVQTQAANTIAILRGAHLVRVHDVVHARMSADVADAVMAAGAPGLSET